MTIYEFANVIDKTLIFTYDPNEEDKILVQFDHSEIKKDVFPETCWGNGISYNEAIEDYITKIKGNRILFQTMNNHIQKFIVPNNLTN